MDSQFTMPMLLATLTMLELLLELTMDMDVFLDMAPSGTVDTLDMDTMDMPTMASMESARLTQMPNLMLILLARSMLDYQFTMPMLPATPTMLELLLELTMDMDVFLDMVPSGTVDML